MAQRNIIHRALATHLQANVSIPNDIAFENVDYDPDGKSIWLEEIFIPNSSDEASIGIGGTQEDYGLYQINVNVPIGNGTIIADNMIEELSQAFSIGVEIEKDGETVYIESSTPAQGLRNGKWYFVPFTVSWSCYMDKN